MTLLCIDCKHSRPNSDPYKTLCASPQNQVEHTDEAKYLVSGIKQPVRLAMRGANCAALRQKRDPHTEATVCGPDGKWFEAKT